MGNQMTIFDYKHIDDFQYKTISDIQILSNKAKEINLHAEQKGLSNEAREALLSKLSMKDDATIDDFCFTFVLPGYEIELVNNGKEIIANIDNCQDYVDLVLHYTFHETIKMQV